VRFSSGPNALDAIGSTLGFASQCAAGDAGILRISGYDFPPDPIPPTTLWRMFTVLSLLYLFSLDPRFVSHLVGTMLFTTPILATI